jgi:hypothetical protein
VAPLVVQQKKNMKASNRVLAVNVFKLFDYSLMRDGVENPDFVGLEQSCKYECPLLIEVNAGCVVTLASPEGLNHRSAEIDMSQSNTPTVTTPDHSGPFWWSGLQLTT